MTDKPLSYENKLQRFVSILKESKKTLFFGGAGVSTESGLKDYRSETGIYKTVTEYGYSPETILSHTFFINNPKVFYKFYREFFISEAKPNDAHKALAKLEKHGPLSCIITQNVDNLHQSAGSEHVLELHGTAEKYYCMKCGKEYTKEILSASDNIPICSCGGIIRPHVTLYEEALDTDTSLEAIDEISTADTLIIGGTSLAVYPAAAYLDYFNGKNLIVINKQETHADVNAVLVFHDSIGKVMKEATEKLLG